MKRFFFLVMLIPCFCFSQITFQKAIGGASFERTYSIKQTTDGGYIAGSTTYTSGTDLDIYLIRTDQNGDTLWTETFGGSSLDICLSVQQTTDGGFIVCGYTKSFGVGFEDIYLIKTDGNGNLSWFKTYGGNSNDEAFIVEQTSDGGFIISGWTDSFGAGSGDIYLIRTDDNGDTLWTKTYGGTSSDGGNSSVQQTTDGGYIITSATHSFGLTSFDVYLIRTDQNGNALWSKTFGGPGNDGGLSVIQTHDKGFIIGSYTDSFGAGSYDAYLIKIDSTGNLMWSKTYGGAISDGIYVIDETNDEGFIMAGYIGSFGAGSDDAWFIKTDSLGDPLWSKTYGGALNEFAYWVQQTNDNGFIIGGETGSFGAASIDIYLIKTDSNGISGCNEMDVPTLTTTPATTFSTVATVVTSPNDYITNPVTVADHPAAIETTICISDGIFEIEAGITFHVSPNPSSGNFRIDFHNPIDHGMLEVFNTLGKKLLDEIIFNESGKDINLKNLSDGIYFVKVFDGARNFCRKIIVANN